MTAPLPIALQLAPQDKGPKHFRAVGFCVWVALIAPLITGLPAWATPCVLSPKEGAFPPHISNAATELNAHQTDAPCGLGHRAERAYQNKRDIEAGLLSEEDAAARGGSALTGEGSMPIPPQSRGT